MEFVKYDFWSFSFLKILNVVFYKFYRFRDIQLVKTRLLNISIMRHVSLIYHAVGNRAIVRQENTKFIGKFLLNFCFSEFAQEDKLDLFSSAFYYLTNNLQNRNILLIRYRHFLIFLRHLYSQYLNFLRGYKRHTCNARRVKVRIRLFFNGQTMRTECLSLTNMSYNS